MIFTDQEITWACKRVLIDELESNKILKESLSYTEKSDFKDFIKNLKLEEINRIFEAPFKLLRDDDFIDPTTKTYSSEPTKADFGNLAKSLSEPVVKKIVHTTKMNMKKGSRSTILKKRLKNIKVKHALTRRFGLSGKIAIAVGLATLLAIIGYLLYRKYHDKCRQLCSKSTDKGSCMRKCKADNIRNIIRILNSEKANCGSDQRCIMKFQKKIRHWEEKIRNIN